MPRSTGRTMGFELRHLRYFSALVEEHNFERAAARLGIAQPGLSQQILNLENILGTALLDRRRRSVQLTPAGQLFFEEARKILGQADVALAAIKRAGRGETGRISVGYVASAAYSGFFTESISKFRAVYPEVELQLVEMEMQKQLGQIAEGGLDFGYIRPPAPLPVGVRSERVLCENLFAALPSTHALAFKSAIDLIALSESTFITARQPPDVGFHNNTIKACREAGFAPKINAAGSDFTTILSMVAVGLGVALVPKSLECLQLPGVNYIKILNNRITSDLAVAYRAAERVPAVRAFIAQHRQTPA
ncbi:LysR substrate-binding domain-containing protein [Phyllobacterium sp. SB3]|uniref:LysR substrate-binding domain-containing protein n=1 Tax=Phyllobacterium sp. SB3 TaxID=3156073 RepID=UPI0032AEFF8F